MIQKFVGNFVQESKHVVFHENWLGKFFRAIKQLFELKRVSSYGEVWVTEVRFTDVRFTEIRFTEVWVTEVRVTEVRVIERLTLGFWREVLVRNIWHLLKLYRNILHRSDSQPRKYWSRFPGYRPQGMVNIHLICLKKFS